MDTEVVIVIVFDFLKTYTSLALYLSEVLNSPVVISTLEKSILKSKLLEVRACRSKCVYRYINWILDAN